MKRITEYVVEKIIAALLIILPVIESAAQTQLWNVPVEWKLKKNTVRADSNSVSKNILSDTIVSLPAVQDTATDDNKRNNENKRRKFLVSGSAHCNIIIDGSKFNSAGFGIGFLPVFIWQPNRKLFFESHLHISAGAGKEHTNTALVASSGGHSHRNIPASVTPLNGGSYSSAADTASSSAPRAYSSIMLAYANLVYFIHPNISLTAGMFPSPFGIYAERIHPEWINKLPDAPLGMGHTDQMIPETELGMQIRGGIPVKNLRFNYALYISNGPALIDTGINAGQLSYENLADNNSNKAIGGRIGMLPFNNSSLEFGLSGQWAKTGTTGTQYEDVDALLYAADFSVNKNFKLLKGNIEVKAQYNLVMLDKVYYKADPMLTVSSPAEDVNLSDSTYRFINKSQLYFLSFSYRPLLSEKFWKNTEYVLRYDALNLPCFALWGQDRSRWSAGILYWFESRSAMKLSYQYEKDAKYLVYQWVIGL